jgi:hypothetical protein
MVCREITKGVHVRVRGKRMVWKDGRAPPEQEVRLEMASEPCGGAVLDLQMNYG